jgi:glycosyltransferase involved in cell wall biosynthesis
MRLVKTFRPQILYSTGPPHSTHLIASKLKDATGLPWVADFRDPWARRPWPVNANPWGQAAAQRLERRCVERADAVVLNTAALRDDFRTHYADLAADKFCAISNGYDPAIGPSMAACPSRSDLSEGRPLRLLHPGTLYGRRDPRPLLLAIKELNARGTRCTLEQVGEVDPRFGLQTLIPRLGLEGLVTIRATLPRAAVFQCMAEADVLVVIQPDAELQVPGKLFEMFAFRKPILGVTGPGETANLIREFQLGGIGAPDDVADIASAIRRIMIMPQEGSGRWDAALETFDGKRLTGALAEVLRSAASKALRQEPCAGWIF